MKSARARKPGAKSARQRKVPAPVLPAAAGRTVRLLVVDDETIARSALRALLETQPDLLVAGEAGDLDQATQLARDLQPDVILVVLPLRGVVGVDGVGRLTLECATARPILLAPALDTLDTAKALQLGARGVVLTDSPTHLLFKSIRCVVDGQVWLGREAITDVLRALPSLTAPVPQKVAGHNLTTREREVLTLVVTGYSNRDVARRMAIGEDTVKHHLTRIFDKTGASNRLELALFAIHHHLVASP